MIKGLCMKKKCKYQNFVARFLKIKKLYHIPFIH